MTIIENERAKLSLDFDDVEEGAPMSRPEIEQRVEQISEEVGFRSRSPLTAPAKSELTLPEQPKRRTRIKTGRTYPFNTKIKPETYELICQLSDEATEAEQRPVSMAEIIERALDRMQKH
jgi:hypothetical protein